MANRIPSIQENGRIGFTMIEIMIVVAIIGILAAIAVPRFVLQRRSAQRTVCISNMKQIFGAAEQWKLAPGNAGVPAIDDLVDPDSGFIKSAEPPSCPAGGAYALTDTDCTCDYEAPEGYEHLFLW